MAQQGAPEVTYQDLLNGLKDPTRWLTYPATTADSVIAR
jgi:hypothetical protein